MDIYAIYDGSEIRYIGQSVDGHARQRQHWNDRHRRSCSLHKWLRTLDERPPYRIIAVVEDDLAHDIERAAIIALRRITNGRLLNDKVRGSISAETRARLSAALTGRPVSAETRAKIGAANSGRRFSPEVVEANRQRAIQRWDDPGQRDRLLAAQRSEETRAKRSRANTGKRHAPESIAKASAAKAAQWADPEFRKKMIAASGNAKKTHCPKGHPLSGSNLYVAPGTGRRNCRTCQASASARAKARRREKLLE